MGRGRHGEVGREGVGGDEDAQSEFVGAEGGEAGL